ncbi:MAG: hypothetical protein UZ17_ACD001002356 [Acidobacteria bacterium OLB17]|nr:MAG: hypothetical protein UZ17_ACD001002356 [Acidobacteria bacterium OLB17]MCZ2392074.1 hypothetical protein [Acidobacteriota bacterium]
METLTRILYVLAGWNVIVLLLVIFAAFGAAALAKWAQAARTLVLRRGAAPTIHLSVLRWAGWLAFAFLLLVLPIAIVNVIRPHAIDGALVFKNGETAVAKVLSVEETSNTLNDQPVMRHNVIFKTARGENIETYFDSWDFNIYPSANSVDYPDAGETFRVAYLPNYPTTFVILTEADSQYTKTNQCSEILGKIEEARNKYEFDPKDENFKAEYARALADGIESSCGEGLSEKLNSLNVEGAAAK